MIITQFREVGKVYDEFPVVEVVCPVCGVEEVEALEVGYRCMDCGVEFRGS